MIETLLGTLLGGAFRVAPEILKHFDRKNERTHELAMFDKQLAADAARSQHAIDQIQANSAAADSAGELTALIEATKAQGRRSGVKWIDGLSSLMRPLITFWWVIFLATAAKVANYFVLLSAGVDPLQAVQLNWGPDDSAIVASIISFWFVDRSLRKR